MKLNNGDRVYVPGEKRGYKIITHDNRYYICTKPHFGTVLYFIVDLFEGMRGPDNVIFCSGYETEKDCKERLTELQCRLIELSSRRSIPLDLTDKEGNRIMGKIDKADKIVENQLKEEIKSLEKMLKDRKKELKEWQENEGRD